MAQLDTTCLRLFEQRRQQRAILNHMRERLIRLDFAAEGEERRPYGIAEEELFWKLLPVLSYTLDRADEARQLMKKLGMPS